MNEVRLLLFAMELNLLDELLGASRTKHLRYFGEGLFRGGIVRSFKVLLSPRTGSIANRIRTVMAPFDPQKVAVRLPKTSRLPRDFVRLEPWEIEYLYSLAGQSTLGVVETGRFRGGSTLVLAAAAPNVPVWSIDINPQDDVALRLLMSELRVGHNVNLIVDDSTCDVPGVGGFDLLFIDGDHSLEGCSGDIERWWPRLAPGGNMVLHDCYLGCEVLDAVSAFLRKEPSSEVVVGMVNGRKHFRSPTGSICHIRKSCSAWQ